MSVNGSDDRNVVTFEELPHPVGYLRRPQGGGLDEFDVYRLNGAGSSIIGIRLTFAEAMHRLNVQGLPYGGLFVGEGKVNTTFKVS